MSAAWEVRERWNEPMTEEEMSQWANWIEADYKTAQVVFIGDICSLVLTYDEDRITFTPWSYGGAIEIKTPSGHELRFEVEDDDPHTEESDPRWVDGKDTETGQIVSEKPITTLDMLRFANAYDPENGIGGANATS